MGLSRRTALRFIDALTHEGQRTMKHLRVPGYPRPYYLSYLLRDIHTLHIWGRLGDINHFSDLDSRNLYCDCRVGSYRYDQVAEGGLDDNDTEAETYDDVDMPIGSDVDALRYHVWKLTDGRYREAVRDYLRKKSQHITYVDANGGLPSFRRRPPVTDLRIGRLPAVDVEQWKRFIIRASRVVKAYPQVQGSWVELRVRDTRRLFVNSEGSQLADQQRVCELSCELWRLSPSGENIRSHVVHVTPAMGDLPDLRQFKREIRERVRLLDALAQAPTLKSFAGPVLLAPQPAGILFHEVLGHRLEGSRLLSTREGQTFKRDLGKPILPDFLSLEDDPTLGRCAGVRPVGSYRYDDEGSPAARAQLVDRGRLVGFLSGRAPVAKGVQPNGHARNECHERPVSRMAHLRVTAAGGIPHAELKQRFLDEIRRQKVPFGVMILDAEGGETATESYDFQAFMGSIAVAVRVFADGRQELLRNVSFVGTPLSALRTVLCAGDTPVCQNGYCGAESGMVPVSTTCPAVLLSNLELQASDQRKFTPYVLPMPFEPTSAR